LLLYVKPTQPPMYTQMTYNNIFSNLLLYVKTTAPPMYTQMTYNNTFLKFVTICQNHHAPDAQPNDI